MAVLFWFVLRRIVRITKVHRITSIADFIGSRYGKSGLLAGMVTLIAVLGILPYISIQLKAIATSFSLLRQYPQVSMARYFYAASGLDGHHFLCGAGADRVCHPVWHPPY
jgi:Na+/proline symporter